MAIVETKKIELLAMRADREPLLRLLQRLACSEIQAIPLDQRPACPEEGSLDALNGKLSRLRWAIRELDRHAPPVKQGLIEKFSKAKPQISAVECERILADEGALWSTVEAAEACERALGELRARALRIRAAIAQYTPWAPLDIPLQRVGATRDTRLMLGQLPIKAVEGLRQAITAQALPVALHSVNVDRKDCQLLLMVHAGAVQALGALLQEAGFAPVQFPGAKGTVAENIAALQQELADIAGEEKALDARWVQLSPEAADLKVLHDLCQAHYLREQAAQRFVQTRQTLYLRAWVPAPAAEGVRAAVLQTAPDTAIEITDPLDDEKPPTLLRNHWFPTQFEGVVSGFSLPDPRGLDPTFMMAPFFACLFGMMVSDAGYGLLMAVLIPLIIHLIKPRGTGKKMLWLLSLGGGATLVWGFLFNTWFGAPLVAKAPLLDPMAQPLEMVALCLGVGLVHLFTAMGIGAYINFKRGKPWDAVFDQFSWLAIIGGVLLLALPGLLGLSPVWGQVGQVLALVGVALVLFFAGRSNKNFVGRIVGGLGSLYNITGWLGDLLSYTRLFGMGLATGVVGMVINMLAGMIMGGGPLGVVIGLVVMAGGHAFNMAINVLGAYVHACRLQYIEFFGKFYEDGGVPFRPLHADTRFVDLPAKQQ
ncbi:MAG: V-type ATP synthase subunit I [Oscillospiraceae bacterium]|jgi:V/A-type H+-transporting ATPase subunit I|nr:V-type ATP synthase subunit I [Oscillospiraceae bacterium]